MKKTLLSIVMIAASGFSFAQGGLWKAAVKKSDAVTFENKRVIQNPRLFELDVNALRQSVSQSPQRFSGKQSNVIVSFPDADGKMAQFRVYEHSNMDPELASRYPDIKAYVGQGTADPSATVYFSISPLGLQTMTLYADRSAVFIEPYTTDLGTYAVYRKSDKAAALNAFECKVAAVAQENSDVAMARPNADDAFLRTFRLAMSVTGEYTAYFGGTKALALAAINNSMTRVNGVFEKDFAARMVLISNTDAVIYTSASTDPYSAASTGAGGAWNGELQNTLTSVIGEANYDVGHLFGASGGGGNAGCIGCVCVNGQKGSGYTSPGDGIPQGDNFDIDYVAHELGHQFGANHTFTHGNEGTGVQMEPGSGSTIMGYAGITTKDVQPHSDAYFHAVSIQQVTNNIKAKTCPVKTATGNSIPTANAGLDYTVPKSTPFMLTGAGTDANGDALTYNWEQMNSGTSTTTTPNATKTSGPNFRSYNSTVSPVRYFPKMSSVLAGSTTTAGTEVTQEALPSVARTLNFRVTVRDNRPGGAGNNSDDMVVTVNATAGPFAVSAPNTAVSWVGGSTQTVTWSVAGTTANGVNCANVDILHSADGGNTWNTILAATPNDGTQAITVPNTAGTQNRIMVKGTNHIFFDVSNANFTITGGSTDTVAPSSPTLSASGTTQTSTNLSWTASTDNVGVTGYDIYQNSVYKTTVSGTAYTVTGLTASTAYSFFVRAKDAAGNASVASNTVNVTTLAPAADTTAPSAPLNLAASGTTSTATNLSWTASTDNVGVTGYDVYQNGAYKATISGTTSGVTGLTPATAYTFYVVAKDAAGNASAASNTVTVTTLSTTLTYCASQGNSVADEKIGRVQFNTINNPSTGGTGYTNFTSVSTTVTRGSAYTITITPQWTSTVYSEGYAVWIDYNQDGDFTDAGETAYTKATSTATTATGTITIPAGATLGSTRMRVSMKYNGTPTACETFSYGQVEDYTVNIAAARENETLAFQIFPNPVSGDELNVSSIENNSPYRIVNMLGQEIGRGKVLNGTVPVSGIASGTYLLEVTSEGQTAVKRFIRK
ncbi:MAG TPA: GEVED domain-containing protein [Flavobacterium sp.]|jgi:chitodextrinase